MALTLVDLAVGTSNHSTFIRYALAVCLFGAALAIRLLALPIEAGLTFLTFYPAAAAAFYLCGPGPGRLFVALSALAAHFVLLPTNLAWSHTLTSAMALGIFVPATLTMGWLIEAQRLSKENLAQLSAELLASEQNLQRILEDQTDFICRLLPGTEGLVLYTNEPFRRMFGPRCVAGVPLNWQSIVVPEDLPHVVAAVSALKPTDPIVQFEARVRDASNQTLWANFVCRGKFNAQGKLLEVQASGRDTTERKALELRLQESSAALRDLYDNAPAGYFSINERGIFVRINDVALAWLGLERQELLGKKGPIDFFDAQGVAQFRREFPKFLRLGRVDGLEFNLQGHKRDYRRVSVSATAVYDSEGHFVMSRSVMHDITEVHKARQAIERMNAEQATMLDNDIVGIAKVVNRKMVWHNRAMDRIFGYGADELSDKSTRLLFPNEAAFLAAGKVMYPVLKQAARFRADMELRHRDGSTVWVDLNGMLLSPDGEESLWMMIDITQAKTNQSRIENLAFHDALTGLPNRLLLADRMTQAMQLCERMGSALAVCYVDLDDFKAINDEFGHEAGDTLLMEVAYRLLGCLRQSDSVARIGGDEFVVLLAPVTTPDECKPIVDRMVSELARPVNVGNGHEANVTASVGVCYYPQHGTTAQELLAKADAAMYDAKQAGRNRSSVHGELA